MNKRFILTAAGASTAAIAGAATADVTHVFGSTTLNGGEYASATMGLVSGSLTGITYTYGWENINGDSSWASDMVFGMSDGFWGVSIGGFNLGMGDMNVPVTPPGGWFYEGGISGGTVNGIYSGTVSFSGSYQMSNTGTAYLGNGWNGSTGTITDLEIIFHGVNAVPAPGALALLGLAGLAGGSRRRK